MLTAMIWGCIEYIDKYCKLIFMMNESIILEVQGLTKRFGHIQALDGVSLEVRAGAITAIVGDNGSGKSTLIKILSGNLRPDSGSIHIGNKTCPGLTIPQAISLGIRTVYQDLALDNYKNSVDNIFLGSELMQGPFLNRRAMRREAEKLLADIHVAILDLTEPVASLSGGQRQGVAIARALRRPGKLLLLDEPTAAMGIQESHSTLEMLAGLRQRGMTQLIVSHNLHQVFALADYVYVMRSGRVIAAAATGDTTAQRLQELILRRESETEGL